MFIWNLISKKIGSQCFSDHTEEHFIIHHFHLYFSFEHPVDLIFFFFVSSSSLNLESG